MTKRFFIFFASLILFSFTTPLAHADSLLIGNDSGTANDGYAGGYIVYTKYTATATGNINTLHAIGRTSCEAKFAIYSDASDHPGTLLNSTSNVPISSGNNVITFPSTSVISGDVYWLTFYSDTTQCMGDDTGGSNLVYYDNSSSNFPSTATVSEDQTLSRATLIAGYNVTPDIKIISSPSTGSVTVGTPFNVDVRVTDNLYAFNAARATVGVSSNLLITGVHNAATKSCNMQYTQSPTTSNSSFAGAIFGGSSTGCTVYTLTLTPTATGTGTITFTNGSVKQYSDNSEILTGVTNGSFTISDGPTPTPTPDLGFIITNPLLTYHTSFNLTGTKLAALTHIFVNSSEANSTYLTSTTWQNAQTLSLGDNNFTLYGSDDDSNQTATQTVTISRHTLGDINGDGNIDLIDASLLAVDWDKTSGLTYILSDMNDDGNVDLTDISILAKLEE